MLAKKLLLVLAPLAIALPGAGLAQSGAPPLAGRFREHQLRDLKLVVVQSDGRLEPLDTLARETVRLVTEESRWQGQEPALTYLSWMFERDAWMQEPMVAVGSLPLRREVGLDPERAFFSIQELRGNEKLMAIFSMVDAQERSGAKLDEIQAEAKRLGTKILALNRTLGGEALRVLPNPADETAAWFNFSEVAQAPFFDVSATRGRLGEVIDALQKRDGVALAVAGARLRSELARIAPDAMPARRALESEVRYNSLNPFHRAWILYLAAFALLLPGLFVAKGVAALAGLVPLGLGFALHLYGMTLRMLAAGRPPLANFYESMIVVAAAVVMFGLVFAGVCRSRIVALTAAGLGMIVLLLAENLPVGSAISPLAPAPRNNIWLTLHVLTILLGCAAALLAGGLACVGLGAHASGRGGTPLAIRLDGLHYRLVQLTVLCLGTGTVLGGVWAKQAWGRYWGWDPKETWALISILVYVVILHGRLSGWLERFGTCIASLVGLDVVLMTSYGASYFLVGLHRDAGGTAHPVPTWVWLFLGAETLLAGAAYLAAAWQRRHKDTRGAGGQRLSLQGHVRLQFAAILTRKSTGRS